MPTPAGLYNLLAKSTCESGNNSINNSKFFRSIENTSHKIAWLIPCSAPGLITIEQERLKVLKVKRMVMR